MKFRAGAGFALLVAVLWAVPTARAQTAPLWYDLAPGPHEVGFRRLWELDPSRVWPRSTALDSLEGTIARPVRMDAWYPASCEASQRMPLGSYLQMEAPAHPFEDVVSLTRAWDEYSYRGLAGDSVAFDRLMRVDTAACLEAPAAPGRFPLVVYSAGWYNRAPDNTILAEFLASHGFVVVTVPQLNPGLWTYNFRSDALSVENQVRDLEVALGAMSSEPVVDRRRIAAMGYSTGGDVVLLLQGRNPLVRAVVSLDGSWTLGPDNDVLGSPFFLPDQHRMPILAARRPTGGMTGADQVLDSLDAAFRIVVEIPGSDHGSFSDDPAQRRFLGADVAQQQATHAEVAQTVLEFLRATLMDSSVPDGAELAQRYRARGLSVTVRTASE